MSHIFFDDLKEAAKDPILGLTETIQADPRPKKINLTVGVYQDEQGGTPVLDCVRKLEAKMAQACPSRNYLGIEGMPAYLNAARKLLLGADHPAIAESRVASVQSPGGTGGLRIVADFIAKHLPTASVWLSNPTWPNHASIFSAAGIKTQHYAYLAADRPTLDQTRFLEDLAKIPRGDMLLIHGCCHNPTGVDPSAEVWEQAIPGLVSRGVLPLVDLAYQGFGAGLIEDSQLVRTLAQAAPELIVVQSFSKNFGLYAERVGAVHLIAHSAAGSRAVLSQFKAAIRANYSNPPAHGARVVAGILENAELKSLWQAELAGMRERILQMRHGLVHGLRARGVTRNLDHFLSQRGMFTYTGLTGPEVTRLQQEFAVYLVGSGRINVAGVNRTNLDQLCAAIATVWGHGDSP